jgi:hypothetical protein
MLRTAIDLARAFPATTITVTMLLIFLPVIIEIFSVVQRLAMRGM